MTRNQTLARLFRALSGETQKAFAGKTGVHPVLLAQYELGEAEPGRETLERLARGADLTVDDGEEILRFAGTLSRPRRRAGQGEETLAGVAAVASRVHQRLLRLPPDRTSAEGDSAAAGQQWARLQELPEDQRGSVVQVAREFQNRALAQRVSEESVAQAARDPERAASLARLAREIADLAGEGARRE